jgi:hypothetical protein
MVKTFIANSLWCLASANAYAAFAFALNDPAGAQERVLRSFLRKNALTIFAREHGLSPASTPAEFARRVPIRSYDEFLPWIDRVRRGVSGVLTAEPVRRLVPTSGSTAARKLIPYTTSMHRQLNRAIGPWIFDLYRNYPGILSGASYWSISPVSSDGSEAAEDTCVPIGFDDDTAYLGTWRKNLVSASMAVPAELRNVDSIEDWRYITALLLLGQDHLALVSVWHPSFFLLILRTICNHWDQLLADLATGRCAAFNRLTAPVAAAIGLRKDPVRSRELQARCPQTADQLWPKLKMLSCWADGNAAGAAAELSQSLGSIAISRKGLLATEGVISIPFHGRHPLAIRSHFLEFENDAGEILAAGELKQGREYDVILTTAGGLWRYRLGDRIEVDGMLGRTPSIRFIGRSGQVSDLAGEKLAEGFVVSVFSQLFRGHHTRPSFAMLAPDLDENGHHYTLYASADIPTGEIDNELDRLLSANPHYKYCRQIGQLSRPRVFRVSGNAYEAYCRRLQRMQKCLGEIKPVALSLLGDWSTEFKGHYGL